MELTINRAVEIFTKARRPFVGSLIAPADDPAWTDGCPYCAQGLILHHSGMSDNEIWYTAQNTADREVAMRLGISVAESVLLRWVNDSADGLPQKVLILSDDGIGSVVGPEWKTLVKFWRHLDRMTPEQWDAAGDAAWTAAGYAAAWAASWAAAGDAARAAAWDAAGDAAWAAAWAANEIQGRSKLTKFFFLPLFGFAHPDAVDALPLEVSHG